MPVWSHASSGRPGRARLGQQWNTTWGCRDDSNHRRQLEWHHLPTPRDNHWLQAHLGLRQRTRVSAKGGEALWEHNSDTRKSPCLSCFHDDVIKWKHFLRYWPFVRGIHRWPVNSPHKGQWRGALMFPLICTWRNSWINNREAGYLRSAPLRPLWCHCNVLVVDFTLLFTTMSHCCNCTIILWQWNTIWYTGRIVSKGKLFINL